MRPGKNAPDAAGGVAWAASAVERGLAEWVTVEGWADPALLAVGKPTPAAPWHRPASDVEPNSISVTEGDLRVLMPPPGVSVSAQNGAGRLQAADAKGPANRAQK
jgi:hypothetical protein